MQRAIMMIGLAIICAATSADADKNRQTHFVGIHPIPKAEGGGICYIEGPHVHIYPADKIQYRDHEGAKYFVGDPVAYGYDGPRHAYKGHHPIHVEAVVGEGEPDVEYCYIDGPHFHYFEPPAGPDFKLVGGAYFYVGEPPKAYLEARPAMIEINAVYRPLVYVRPTIDIEAPVGWIGARVDLGPRIEVNGPHVIVEHPGIAVGAEVHIPVPSIHVGIGIGVPGVVVHDRVEVHEVHGHHDNGWHKGHR